MNVSLVLIIFEFLDRLQSRVGTTKRGTTRRTTTGTTARKAKPSSEDAVAPTSPNRKEARVWAGGAGKINAKQKAALDRSKQPDASNGNGTSLQVTLADQEARELEQSRSIYMPEQGERPMWELEAEEAKAFDDALAAGGNEDETSSNANDSGSSNSTGGGWSFGKTYLGGLLQSVTGNKVLDESDLSPVLERVKESLQAKNVAQEIADEICSSVGASLVGHKLASFTRIQTVVTNSLRDAVQRVLTPKTSTDILRQVLDARAEGKVFSAVFIGINGVGKSTSLAKVAYYLKEHGIKVMLAACDTFRSGAVEQLRTHSRCLDAPLFELGYAKDPSRVAAAAIAEAKELKMDCVLIDTAGRMQNNEPLMRALAKLITENSPDLVLFVGEISSLYIESLYCFI